MEGVEGTSVEASPELLQGVLAFLGLCVQELGRESSPLLASVRSEPLSNNLL